MDGRDCVLVRDVPRKRTRGQGDLKEKSKCLQLTFAYTSMNCVLRNLHALALSASTHLSRGTPALCISPVWVTVSRDKLRNSTVRYASRGSEIAIKGINHIYARFFFFHTLDTRSVYVLEYTAFSNFGENPTKNDPSFKVSNDKGVRLTYTSTHRRAHTYEFIHTRNGFKIPKVLQYLHVFRSIIPANASTIGIQHFARRKRRLDFVRTKPPVFHFVSTVHRSIDRNLSIFSLWNTRASSSSVS